MQPQDFPLHWPEGRPRTATKSRVAGRFTVSFQEAYDSLVDEAERIHTPGAHGRDVIISTNVPLSVKGMPIVSEHRRILDRGVAVYLWVGEVPYALACDTYEEVHHNMRALAATLGALRTIMRHGTGQLFAQSMAGFARELEGRPAAKMLAGGK